MKAARVLYAIDTLQPSGAEWSLLAMAPYLQAAGIHLEVVHFDDRPGLGPRFEAIGVSVSSVTEGSVLGRIRKLRRLIERSDIDLVHTTLYQADVAGRLAGAWSGRPVVSSLVNTAYGPAHRAASSIPSWKLAGARLVDLTTARAVTRFHAISETVANEMAERLRVPASKIDVVPRGRDPAALGRRDPARTSRVRRSLGIDQAIPLVLMAARHEPQKALDVGVAAFAKVRRAVPGARLLIAGRRGRASQTLLDAITHHRLQDVVGVLGWRNDVPDLLAAADAFLFPTRWEGMGSVLIEAMALEVPIIASNLPVIREVLVDDGQLVGWLAPVGQADALAEGILSALSHPADRPQRARERFLRRYTAAAAADGMMGVYRRAIGHP